MSTAALGFTSVTVSSSAGKPPADWRMRVGNFTPPKSLYSP